MSGTKGHSGRKPRHQEESKILEGLYPKAISTVRDILNDKSNPANVRLEAALAVIWKKIGKPRQSVEAKVAILDVADWYALQSLEIERIKAEEVSILEGNDVQGQREAEGSSEGEDEALQE